MQSTEVLKFGLQSEHNWSIIGKILTEVLKCHESTGNFALILGYWRLEALAFDGFGGSSLAFCEQFLSEG